MKSASVEVYLVPKKKIRSKAIQVRLLEDAAPLGSGSSAEPRPHLRLVKRPRTTSLSPVTHHPCCRGNHGPSTHTPDTKREEHSYAIQTPNVIVCKTEASSPSSSPPSSPGCSGFPSVPSVRGDTPMEEEEEDKEEEEKSAMLVFAQVEVSIDGDDVVSDLEEDITDMSSSVEDVTEDEEEEEDVTEDKERGLEEADRGMGISGRRKRWTMSVKSKRGLCRAGRLNQQCPLKKKHVTGSLSVESFEDAAPTCELTPERDRTSVGEI